MGRIVCAGTHYLIYDAVYVPATADTPLTAADILTRRELQIALLIAEGKLDETLITLARGNSRYPAEMEGDLMSLAACNAIGVGRLREMLREFPLGNLTPLCDQIVSRSREAAIAAIAGLPAGTTTAEMVIDGYDKPVALVATTTISSDLIQVDFTGTSGLS
ncbi:hypothetical protein EN801_036180, partial [Mesorhizobium sp. M00.F.Ca.ET.158.01.1.1]